MITYFRGFLMRAMFVSSNFRVMFGFSNREFCASTYSLPNNIRFLNNRIFQWKQNCHFLPFKEQFLKFVYCSNLQIIRFIFSLFLLQNGTWQLISFRYSNILVGNLDKIFFGLMKIIYYRIDKCIGIIGF